MSLARPSRFVDQDRLWRRHEELARFGATARGGVNRQALSPEDAAARLQLVDWARPLGLTAKSDAVGNLFLVLKGRDAALSPVLSGSHIDSQPTGGRFDGAYGVLAALEAVEALLAAGLRPRRSIEVVAWMNEEGSRYAPGMMGSAAFAGARSLADILAVRDADGVSVEAALACMPSFPPVDLPRPVHAYVEAHIEQGPVLEREGFPVGIVTGIQGKRTYRVTVTGEEAHAGTAPRGERRDALFAAMDIVSALRRLTDDPEGLVRFTVGAFTVRPNAPSVVPSSVVFSIDLRHYDAGILASLGDRVETVCETNAGVCHVAVEELSRADPKSFPVSMRDRIRAAAGALGIPHRDLPSAAGHDAGYLHLACETGMIFVPCRDGVSHREDEWAEPAALADGARVLTETLAGLADCAP
ncbi:Zn-dependent hydrolase [Oceanibacterium hippocampi]|uniref:Hydantoin utilization protein C n=1 Tax=Oceanibacterium hippocampi TaxID=745714 RepID=A0A1Y5TXY9_9PROT|nr:Zn-dependent hydrolase [Oceanibacterium hippocampi]SLN75477.1 Hydantoin utilization protein C [Oceanibacterium hippocampi]